MAPLPPKTAARHRAVLLALFATLVVSSALVTYFMLLPFSQFAAQPGSQAGYLRDAPGSTETKLFRLV
ncbi:hypothetical protein UVI_02053190 [Ustilaginoidea virens]|uniref:Uncharacterized protein n=1 Tax=Ustilaginoidea virens TaxID=1159556 RepID=A0A1B5L677_USTVR|nr:hypothetical protein UVI_02053190 [Ustilaginoidea virens]